MRTTLKYNVEREINYKYNNIKGSLFYEEQPVIVNRYFDFYVSNAKDENEHIEIIQSFQEYLEENNITNTYSCGEGSWEENLRYKSTNNYLYLTIVLESIREKEYVKQLYRQWKELRKDNN